MGKIFEQTINRFDTGIVNDPRNRKEGAALAVTHFDILTDPRRMIPHRASESGDDSAATSQKQNFALALWTATGNYRIFSLGVKSGAATAEVLMKDITTGSDNDLDDATWATPAANQSSAGTTEFELFVYYRKTGKIYGARAGTHIWAFTPDGSTAWADTHQALTYTSIFQGLVHSKDDILYIPYYNSAGAAGTKSFIAKNDNGSWTNAALTLPDHLIPVSVAEYGNYLAILCAPASGVGQSYVFLWNRDTSLATLSEAIPAGEGNAQIIEEIEGELVWMLFSGNSTTRFNNRIIWQKYLGGGVSKKITEFLSDRTGTTTLLRRKQKINNRLYFQAQMYLNGAQRNGIFSFGKNSEGSWGMTHEHLPNNDTAISVIQGFFIIGDYVFQSFTTSGTWSLTKTNDQATFTATSVFESALQVGKDEGRKEKDLIAVGVMTEAMPADGQIVLKYKKDEETSYTTIFTSSTDNKIYYEAVNIESTGIALPRFREISFRIESTGKAIVTGLYYKYEEVDTNPTT